MIKFAIQQWDKNKSELEKYYKSLETFNDLEYKDIVANLVRFVYVDDYYEYDSEEITEIDNGDYEGTVLWMIPRKTYQPDAEDYLLTYTGYGSCSGCDTLLSIQESWTTNREEQINDLMELSLHLVQNTIRPYNAGWRHDELFDAIEMEEN